MAVGYLECFLLSREQWKTKQKIHTWKQCATTVSSTNEEKSDKGGVTYTAYIGQSLPHYTHPGL